MHLMVCLHCEQEFLPEDLNLCVNCGDGFCDHCPPLCVCPVDIAELESVACRGSETCWVTGGQCVGC